MVEYIKREDAIEALGEEPYVWSDADAEIAEHAQWVSDVKAIEAVPPADVVEIKKEGEWDMFDLISSAWYGKGMYFKQDNGIVYSRRSNKYMTVDEAIKEFISLINEENIAFVPSVTTMWADGEAPTYVLQKHGKWEEVGGEDEGWRFYRCTICGAVGIPQYHYCPNCGADMREEN